MEAVARRQGLRGKGPESRGPAHVPGTDLGPCLPFHPTPGSEPQVSRCTRNSTGVVKDEGTSDLSELGYRCVPVCRTFESFFIVDGKISRVSATPSLHRGSRDVSPTPERNGWRSTHPDARPVSCPLVHLGSTQNFHRDRSEGLPDPPSLSRVRPPSLVRPPLWGSTPSVFLVRPPPNTVGKTCKSFTDGPL